MTAIWATTVAVKRGQWLPLAYTMIGAVPALLAEAGHGLRERNQVLLLVSGLSKRGMMVAFLRWRKLKKEQMCRGKENKVMFCNGFEVCIRDLSGLDIVKLAAWVDESGIQRGRIGHIILKVIRI